MSARPPRTEQTHLLLLFIRWISLLPPLAALVLSGTGYEPDAHILQALVFAVLLNAALTLFRQKLPLLIQRWPWLVLFDLFIAGAFVWYTGIEQSPFYFYSLTPILGAAYFLRMRGALGSAGLYSLVFLAMVFLLPRPHGSTPVPLLAISQVIGFFVIALMVGYVSVLLDDLRRTHHHLEKTNIELSRRNRDLNLIQELTLLLQSSVDPAELQELILRGLVHDLGYRRATIGLYEEEAHILTGWLTLEKIPTIVEPRQLSHATTISLHGESGPIARAVASCQPVEVFDGARPVQDVSMARRLVTGKHYLVLPLTLRGHLLGVIIVDQLPVSQPLSDPERESLERLAAHAGVALGSVRLCIHRAQQQAILAERNRIAAELHDSISQVLYGLAYGLDACVQLLPEHPEMVRRELAKLQPVVADAQARMRKAIFAMHTIEITSDAFSARLHRHLHAICPARDLTLRIELPGEFDRWDEALRQQIYRVAQEAMTNAARHAEASRILVTVLSQGDRVGVRVEDDGRGFNPADIDPERHLGIRSMTARVQQLGGDLTIESKPNQGTVVLATIPHRRRGAFLRPPTSRVTSYDGVPTHTYPAD